MEDNNKAQKIDMTQEDYDRAIQSAEDKLRTQHSKKVKELEAKIVELTPKVQSEQEKQLEQRVRELETKEKRINLLDNLSTHSIDKSLADYLRDDVDFAKFNTALTAIVNAKLSSSGYTPQTHNNTEALTKEQWKKMGAYERQEFYNKNPELAKKLMSGK